MNFFVYLIVFFFSLHINADEINLYTTRHYDSDIKLYKDFTKQTGINVNIISGKAKPLEKRILEEGKSCKGDLFFLADAGRLYSSQKNGVFKKVSSKVLEKMDELFLLLLFAPYLFFRITLNHNNRYSL